MILCEDCVHKHNIKNKATSNIKIQQVLGSFGWDKVGIYLRDRPFSSDLGIVTLQPSKGTHWVRYANENFFDSYGCVCPKILSEFNMKRNRYCLYSEYEIQKNESFCASFCLYKIYWSKVLGMDFEAAVLNLYYQIIQNCQRFL